MNRTTELHREAMQAADDADAALRAGDEPRANFLYRQALELERQAVESLATQDAPEPTRSVLLRSAASLALSCHEYREAERLIATALAGDPPLEICEELRDLLDKLYEETDLRQVAS